MLSLSSLSANAEKQDKQVLEGVKKYKTGNYMGAIQTMQDVLKNSPDSAMAHYYIAISNVKLGNVAEALIYYDKVIALSPSSQLGKYAILGKKMLDTTPKQQTKPAANQDDKSKDVKPPQNVDKDLEDRNIKYLIEKINKNKTVDPTEYNKFQDYSPSKSSNDKPNAEEIAKAMEVLTKAGINPYTANNVNAAAMNPQMNQMSMLSTLMGGNQQGGNGMNNMLPLMMMLQQGQGQYGTSGNNIDPHLMQTMLTNMMMPSMDDFTSKKDD